MDESARKVRNVKLTVDIDNRLVALCKHLGTNPNSYLINIIGKSVSQDELAFKSQENQSDLFSQVLQYMNQMPTGSDDDND